MSCRFCDWQVQEYYFDIVVGVWGGEWGGGGGGGGGGEGGEGKKGEKGYPHP